MFLVEGNKIIRELHNSNFKIKDLFSTTPSEFEKEGIPVTAISKQELGKISFLQHPKDSVAVCEMNENMILNVKGHQLVLDGIQDPGNLGTIIRLADWFGIEQIVCSQDTADFFNPKVIQASMGSFTRVNMVYTDLEEYLLSTDKVNIGTDMEGDSIYSLGFPEEMNLIMGNEGNGIRPEIKEILKHNITIPRFGNLQSTESLNVAVATGIILGQMYSRPV